VCSSYRQLVPYEGCALLELKENGDRFVFFPIEPEDAIRIKTALLLRRHDNGQIL
jgi:hypothetical protein